MYNEKNKQEITTYENTKSDFTDFTRFEGDNKQRAAECSTFINNREYTPNYDYPKLNFLIDDEKIAEKKSSIYEAVMELEAAKQYNNANKAELELYASFHEMRLKKIMLVEAARNLFDPMIMSDLDVNRQSFAELNESLYGKYDKLRYLGMIATEKDRLKSFNPISDSAFHIKSELGLLLQDIETNDNQEKPLLNEVELQKIHNYVTTRYADVLDVVPDTDDGVYYDVNQCVEIINNSLAAGGLSEYGWMAIEDSAKLNPTTKQVSHTINLPSNTRRTAAELRRLIMHEQEVHARRAQNGQDSELGPIAKGTANYADIEEGFGVMMECAVAGTLDNPSFDRARNRYLTAGLALGAEGKPRDAREAYEMLWRLITVQDSENGNLTDEMIKKAKEKAYSHIENAYRGTQFWMKGVIYTKLKVYYDGLVKNADYFKTNIDNLDIAFKNALIGKYDHTNSTERELVVSAIETRKNLSEISVSQ